ncbi:MAG: ATP synthase F1 subunit delta [Betaproteobacteria bacterium]|nr:ATP synthase F1 subunit delta [Betaproteobacteria bacterium]
MKVSTGQLARRYATALFESAVESKTTDALARESEALLSVITPELEQFFASQARTTTEKDQVVALLIEKIKLSEQTARALQLMSQNNRLHHIKPIFKKVLALSDAHKKVLRAQVKTATTLNPADLSELEKMLSQTTGQSVVVECETDPQLRAGMVVKIGTRQIDSSLKTRLSNLKEFLSQGV